MNKPHTGHILRRIAQDRWGKISKVKRIDERVAHFQAERGSGIVALLDDEITPDMESSLSDCIGKAVVYPKKWGKAEDGSLTRVSSWHSVHWRPNFKGYGYGSFGDLANDLLGKDHALEVHALVGDDGIGEHKVRLTAAAIGQEWASKNKRLLTKAVDALVEEDPTALSLIWGESNEDTADAFVDAMSNIPDTVAA